MELKDIVTAAGALQPKNSTDVKICIDWFRGEKVRNTQNAINRADNEQKAKFVKALLSTINKAQSSKKEESDPAKQELVEILGEENLTHPAVTKSDGFFFSLTQKGTQFRCWYAPFGSVSYDHFDSCGTGIVFHADCADPATLRRWLQDIVRGRVEWTSLLGSVWIGWGRGGYSFGG